MYIQSFKAPLADDAVPMEISNMPVHYFHKSKSLQLKLSGPSICRPEKQFCDTSRELPSTVTLHGDVPCGKLTANRLKHSLKTNTEATNLHK